MLMQGQIRVGNQTSCTAASPGLPFGYAIASGFDTFEWFPDKKDWGQGWLESDISSTERTNIRKKAAQQKITLSVHAPLVVNPLRGETYDAFINTVGFAMDIGAVLINIHLFNQEGMERYVRTLEPYIRHTAELSLKLSIENTPDISPDDINRAFELIGQIKHIPTDHVGMCFDIGHANVFDQTRNDYIRYITTIQSHVPIIHIHMHENYGDWDRHLPIFTGPAGNDPTGITAFVAEMKRRKFSGSIIMEQWPQQPYLLNNARDRLLAIFNDDNV
ncbi:Xylose isomerase-type TIM barrel domain protein [Candidatus Magnetobacterium bavaricum]|uniref:Xylose isomerase-type TIM barrel domain protein n=1 Tax=Candidatus Magnetobacterium bavaricum TaxID=29290 RepID=A0A0F3GTM8_9BACT|nr:Xylose isomerase-type TIM barrel domain protein [Candidatus Magnetobacterium bavaricum]